MKHVILFGDSLLARWRKEQIEEFEQSLDGDFMVYNCATAGVNSSDLIKKGEYIARLKPEIVVLSVGLNDAAPWKRIAHNDFTKNIKQLLQFFSDSKIIFLLPTPIFEASRISPNDRNNSDIGEYRDIIKSECEIGSTRCVDVWQEFVEAATRDSTFYDQDRVHFGEAGFNIIADKLKVEIK